MHTLVVLLCSQGPAHQAKEFLVIHRFSEDGKSPCRRRALSQVVIPVSRNEHDRNLETPHCQLPLHLKTAHIWHRKVENYATDPVQSARP